MKKLFRLFFETGSIALFVLFTISSVRSQISSDGTLATKVNQSDNIFQINGGKEIGTNLFHSFQEFSLPTGSQANFNNGLHIENIINRITGDSISTIDGLIKTIGDANLFLINPHGIIFGENASLDIGGSFIASTADSLIFENGFQFSATNPEAPPLLTINIPLGLQLPTNPAPIIAESLLEVPTNKTLALIGGQVNVSAGSLTTTDGRIELGSMGANEQVNLEWKDNNLTFDYADVQEFQDISLSQGTILNASGDNGGSIQVQGAIVSLSNGSLIFTDTQGKGNGGQILIMASQLILENASSVSADVFGSGQGSSLNINASESIKLIGASTDGRFSNFLGTQVLQGATGKGGNVTIDTKDLVIQDGSAVGAFTFSGGDGGQLMVNAKELIQVIGTANGLFPSVLGTQTVGTGKGGDVIIDTKDVIIQDGGQIATATISEREGGNIIVNARESIQVIGSANGLFPSALGTQTNGGGKAGDVSITTKQLLIEDGGSVAAGTFAQGRGGNIIVNAAESIQVIGTIDQVFGIGNGIFFGNSTLSAQANPGSTGKAGELDITTKQLLLQDGGQVSVATFGEGGGGDLKINASESVQVIGSSSGGQVPSLLNARNQGTGNAGNLNITTRKLFIDSAIVSASTFAEGNGGKLIINAAESVEVTGTSPDGQTSAGLNVQTFGTGNAGEMDINTQQLIVRDGAIISSRTFGEGRGGTININAGKSIQVTGASSVGQQFNSLLTAQTSGLGNAGNINISTGELFIENQGELSVKSEEEGNSGNLNIIKAEFILLNDRGIITAETIGGQEGNIILNTNKLGLRNNSNITTNTENATGGNININTDTLFALENSDITANALEGVGGRVTIAAEGIFGTEFREQENPETSDITATSELGPDFSGQVKIITPEVDPTSGLVTLPSAPIDADAILAQDICRVVDEKIAGGSSFVITGKGGISPTSLEPLENRDRLVDWAENIYSLENPWPQVTQLDSNRFPVYENEQNQKVSPVIQEAQGWIIASDGTLLLTVKPPQINLQNTMIHHPDCSASE